MESGTTPGTAAADLFCPRKDVVDVLLVLPPLPFLIAFLILEELLSTETQDGCQLFFVKYLGAL